MNWSDALSESLSYVFGVPSGALVVVVLATVIYRASLHALLLYGRVEKTGENLKKDGPVEDTDQLAGLFVYKFVIQNLENEDFDKFVVRIRQLTGVKGENGSGNLSLKPERLKVFVGPKIYETSLCGIDDKCDSRPEIRMEFPKLPAFDTWRIEVHASASQLELLVGPSRRRSLFPLIPLVPFVDVRPKRLVLNATEKHGRVVEGARISPGRGYSYAFGAIVLFGYLSGVNWIAKSSFGRSAAFSEAGVLDVVMALSAAFLVLVVARFIRRPVYPVIQGYDKESYRKPLE